MILRIQVLLFAQLMLFVSCNRDQERERNFLKDASLSTSTKIRRYLESDTLMLSVFSKEETQFLRIYYSEEDYHPFLLEQEPSKDSLFSALFTKSLAFGVPREYIDQNPQNAHPVEEDMVNVLNVARMIEIRENGFLDTSGRPATRVPLPDLKKMKTITDCRNFDVACRNLQALGPVSDTAFYKLSNQIFAFAMQYELDSDTLSPKNFPTESERLQLARKSLQQKGYLKSKKSSEMEFQKALISFKLHNGLDSSLQLNNYAIEALCESNQSRLTRAALSLEKIRLNTLNYQRLVLINLPEYALYFYANDSLKAKHRIVIGKRENETPELTSEIRSIVVYPFWKVPASIVKKEIMPELRKNRGYLAKHHYTIRGLKDTSALNIHEINLKSNGYSIVQSPGKWNSLGVIKFEFNNSHSVYVHDTPQKGLFNRAVRSFSHGCMRCEYPLLLSKQFLKYDQRGRRKNSMRPDTLDSLIRIGENTVLPLKTRIPIKVLYQTVIASTNQLVFFIDIYGRDALLLKGLSEVKSFTFVSI